MNIKSDPENPKDLLLISHTMSSTELEAFFAFIRKFAHELYYINKIAYSPSQKEAIEFRKQAEQSISW
jgi:hypothetical protein